MDRVQLKQNGKAAMKRNFWPSVIVALIFALSVGGLNLVVRRIDAGAVSESAERLSRYLFVGDIAMSRAEVDYALSVLSSAFTTVLALTPVSFLLTILVTNILEVGACRFFLVNAGENASVSEVVAPFSDSYIRNVLSQFLRKLYLALWSMLFGIPGVIKAYSYRLVPYILAEDPNLTANEAITMSRRLMKGHKLDAFVLDLSFIGWNILSALTFGILGIFFVKPYIHAAHAELYRTLRYPETIRQYED